jgi:hypothetical protein
MSFGLALGLAGMGGCLTYSEFLDKKAERYCEELEKCNPDAPCETPWGIDTGYGSDECTFDAQAARDCLKGTWTCTEPLTVPGFAYPRAPEACELVCGPML